MMTTTMMVPWETERSRKGWSRAELARRARMAAADAGKIEAGCLVPYPRQRRKLARALGLSAEEAAGLVSHAGERAET